jgi:glutathione peroxidase-family protein
MDYRVKAVPAAFLVDRDGKIVAQWTGRTVDAAELEAQLEALLQAD